MSHIIPKFVYNSLKRTGTRFQRISGDPNRRVQDGVKMHLLCGTCEQRLSQWERTFVQEVFKPAHANTPTNISYGASALKFAVSLSWRVLKFIELRETLNLLSPKQQQRAVAAASTWKGVMLDELKHPGTFEQHMLFVGPVTESTSRVASNLSRYFTRAADLTIMLSSTFGATYAKMGQVVVFGVFDGMERKNWHGTRIAVAGGRVPKDCSVPARVLDFLNDRAAMMRAEFDRMSDAQKALGESAFKAAVASNSSPSIVAAFEADLAMRHLWIDLEEGDDETDQS